MKLTAIVLLLLVSSGIARAEEPVVVLAPACAEVVASGDVLAEPELAAARVLLAHALERENLLVVDTGCNDHFRITHVRSGARWIVRLAGPHATRGLVVDELDGLAEAYAQLVHAVLFVPPPAPAADRVEARDAAAIEPESGDVPAVAPVAADDAPAPVAAASWGMYYVRTGGGSIAGGGSGSSGAVGYRLRSGAIAGDLAFVTTTADRGSSVALSASALHYLQPAAPTSIYVGGGLGLGGSELQIGDRRYSGDGFQVGLSLGAELKATDHWRLFVQGDATLPLYQLDGVYPAAIALSFGAGYGR
jgi:hypothetical protein